MITSEVPFISKDLKGTNKKVKEELILSLVTKPHSNGIQRIKGYPCLCPGSFVVQP